MNENNNYSHCNWNDITKEFQNTSQCLNLGELVFSNSFGLYEAMSAIELMDPKMDAGMVENRPRVCPFSEMVEKKLIKVDNFTYEELIGIIDDTFSCLVTWMDGHSFEQTIYINVFMHDPNLVLDKKLKTFCLVILKIVDFFSSSIHKAYIYEEEDYQMKPKQVLIETGLNHSKYVSLLKSVETDLQKQIEDSKCNDQAIYLKAILVRFQFTRILYFMLNTFRKHTDKDQQQTPLKEFIKNFLSNISLCQKLSEEWSQSLDLGIKPKEDDFIIDSRNQNYPTIMGFEPMINQRLMSPSFPRYTRIKSRPDMLQYLKNFLKRISQMFKVHELSRFDDVLRFFYEFSKHKPSCIVSRSMLFLFYFSKPDFAFGETPFVKVIIDFIKHFINPPIMNDEIKNNETAKQLLESFYARSALVFGTVLQTYSNNRARQREKIGTVLEGFSVLLDQATTLDHCTSTSESDTKNFCYFQFWCLRYYIHLQSQYLFSGFELELYLSHEFAYVYFELEYILNYISLMFQKAMDIDEARSMIGTLNNKTKKSRNKTNKSKVTNYDHEIWLHYYSSYAALSRAMHLICLAFMVEGKIKRPRQNLNSEKIRYEHRFAPLNLFDMVMVGYEKYKNQFETAMKTEPSHLYKTACDSLIVARNKLELIKEPTLQSEIQSQLKVVKTNFVVVNLLLSGHNSQAIPEFNFDEGYYFPIIKFLK